MREGHRFCGRCGHELKPAARFCNNCGHSVPESSGQPAAQGSGPETPAYAPTVTAKPVPGPSATAGERRDSTVGPPPGGPTGYGPGRPPPAQAPPSAGPPRQGTPTRKARLTLFWPLAVALAVLVAGGGTAAGLLLTRHSPAQPRGRDNVTAVTPATPPTTETPISVSPAPPPTQVDIQGMTIGIGAVNNNPNATDVATTMAAYFGGINARNYKQAWDTYTAALQATVPYQPFANALSTSQDSQVTVESIQHDANGNLEADVSFQSHQAGQYGPNPGETCTNWTLDYHLVPAAGATAGPVPLSYRIDKVTEIGAGHASC